MNDDKKKEIEARIAALKKQWPAHSVPPGMLQQLDDLEDELQQAKEAEAHEDSRQESEQ